jgi:ABC-2 type transport system ATP-binding protein
MTAITIDDVTVTFGDLVALNSVSLDVEPGAIVGVLGHNGAGKTTLVRVAATLLRPTRGRVLVAGVDAAVDPFTVRRNIGLTGQYAGLDEYLTPEENLEMVGRILGLGRAARQRAVDLLDRFELRAVADRRIGTLSGGTRRRVDLAASLVGSPMVLFLDEPTTGLDPAARIGFWAVVRELAATGTAVVLTTQYLEEADQLASEIVVIDHGGIVATGTPAQLKSLVGGKVVRATVPTAAAGPFPATVDGEATVHGDSTTWHVPVFDARAAAALVNSVVAAGTAVTDLEIVSPSLDDVFIHLANTGVPA